MKGVSFLKVLIADDDALIRDGLKILLEIEEDFEVVGTACNGQEAFEICREVKPDIVLMDIRMPVMDGVLGTKQIKSHFKDVKVVILTTFKDDEYIKEAVKSGAEGYILKNQPSDSIIERPITTIPLESTSILAIISQLFPIIILSFFCVLFIILELKLQLNPSPLIQEFIKFFFITLSLSLFIAL
jgi:DNA-binding NarL/FixJ family response regulator